MNLQLKRILFFIKGHTRGSKAIREVLYSILIQGFSVITGFLYVPLLLDYLTQEKYGIWLTLTSILGWFSFLDLGMGNGLRNKLTVALANGDFGLGKKLVSTTYALLICIFCVVLFVFHLSNFFLNWNSILNTKTIDNSELYILTSIVFTFFILRFIFQIISVVYLADQKPSSVKMIETSGSVFSFLIVLILTRVTLNGDLILLGTIISVIPVILFFVVTIVAFKTKYKKLKPTVKDIDFKVSKGILNLGAKFFFMQISFIIVFTTSNFFIAQFYGPEEVTVFNIAFKYFKIPIMIFSIFMSPLWSAVTDAYAKSDYAWLKKTLKYSNMLTALFSVGVILMVFISNWVYKIWIGDKVIIPIGLTVSLGIYTIIDLFITPYSYFINGMGKLRVAVIFTFIEIIVFFILIFLFGNLFKNSIGIVFSISLIMIMLAIIFSFQTSKLLNNNAKGIWNK
jgi:O-antigen/teichoic acid export membrane protein